MGALSKEIEKLEAGYFWMRGEMKMLKHLQKEHPHLDHPATPYVEEMEKVLKRASSINLSSNPNDYGKLSEDAFALLQKIKEAE